MGKLPEAQISPFLFTLSQYGDPKDLDYSDLHRKLSMSPSSESTQIQVKSLRPLTPSDEDLLTTTLEGQVQTPFALFTLPVYSAMRFFGFIDYKVTFDMKEQKFVYVPGSLFRKIRSFLVCIITTVFLYIECEYQQHVKKQSGLTSLMAMMKIIQLCYLSLSVTFVYVLNTRGHMFPQILNQMQRVTAVLEREGCGVPRRSSCTLFSKTMLTLMLFYGVIYVLDPYLAAWTSGSLETGIIETFADDMVKAIAVSVSGLGFQVPVEWLQYTLHREQPIWVVMVVAAVRLIFHYMFTCVWIFTVMLFILWALAFAEIFRSFINLLAHRPSRNTLQDIRKFNLMTTMLDKFNEALGLLTLIACVTCIAHFSIHVQYLVDSSIWWLGKTSVAIGLIYFAAMLILGSKVNQEASRIVEVMKSRFQDMPVWRKQHGQCAETTQGLLLLLAEIQTNNVGFKGLTFFTITYSFIGTVLSVISTYAMVVLQIKTVPSG